GRRTTMPTLQPGDLDQARRYFDQTRNRVVEATGDLSDAQRKFKPAPNRWSIGEILEHMVIVQERILGPIREQWAQGPAPSPDRDNGRVDAIVLEKIPDRSIKAKAPQVIEPTGTCTVAASLDRFRRNYERLNEFVESAPDLREHVLESLPLKFVTNGEYQTMDGYQWALTVAAHDQRHLVQIMEVKADPNYPVC